MQSACRCFGRNGKGPPSPYFSYPKEKTHNPREVLVRPQYSCLHLLCICLSYRRCLEALPLNSDLGGPSNGTLLPPPAHILHGGQGRGLNGV